MLTTHLNKAIMSLRDATTSNRPLCINSFGEHLWLHTKKSFLNLYCFHIAVEMTSFSMRRVRPLHVYVAAHCPGPHRSLLLRMRNNKAGGRPAKIVQRGVALNLLVSLFGRFVARGGRKRGNRHTHCLTQTEMRIFRTVCWPLCTAMLIWQVTPLPHGALHSDKPVFKKAIMILVQIVGEGIYCHHNVTQWTTEIFIAGLVICNYNIGLAFALLKLCCACSVLLRVCLFSVCNLKITVVYHLTTTLCTWGL